MTRSYEKAYYPHPTDRVEFERLPGPDPKIERECQALRELYLVQQRALWKVMCRPQRSN